ncbi:MAG: phosphonate catabolism associated alcohol dehydrogenase [Schlesneria sp.]|nr:phosphonate catabolism associated alcohol dehydrogenase [Schlesneria sp.]
MNHSLAAIFDGTPGAIEVRDLPLPELHGAEMLVRVLGCTLCGSDLHSFDGRRSVPIPTILGHEIVGEIVAFGETASRRDFAQRELTVGDRITWAIVASCGDCFYCQRDLPQKCLRSVKYGHEIVRPGQELLGGLAEHCLLVHGTAVVRLPSDLPLSVACPANCATATIVAALEAAGPLENRNVCIFGAGMLGLTACAMARCQGAAIVVCVEPDAARRQRALKFGATHVSDCVDLAAMTRQAGLQHGFDAVLELSGHPSAFDAAWPLIRTGGTLVLVGSVFPAAPVPLSFEQIVRRQLTIRGIHNYAPRHLLTAVEFLSRHHHDYPFAELVTQWVPLTSIADAFQLAKDPGAIRIGVHSPNVR